MVRWVNRVDADRTANMYLSFGGIFFFVVVVLLLAFTYGCASLVDAFQRKTLARSFIASTGAGIHRRRARSGNTSNMST